MRHQSLNAVHQHADVRGPAPRTEALTTTQRRERWADILHAHGKTMLNALEGTEFRDPVSRAAMRRDNTPLSLAHADPLLRADGLVDDSYGEAKRYFGLSDVELHHVVCDCHVGARMSGSTASGRVRSLIPGSGLLNRCAGAIRRWLS